MVVGVDRLVVVAQVKEGTAFLVPGMEVMGVLCNGPVKILEGLTKPAEIIQRDPLRIRASAYFGLRARVFSNAVTASWCRPRPSNARPFWK